MKIHRLFGNRSASLIVAALTLGTPACESLLGVDFDNAWQRDSDAGLVFDGATGVGGKWEEEGVGGVGSRDAARGKGGIDSSADGTSGTAGNGGLGGENQAGASAAGSGTGGTSVGGGGAAGVGGENQAGSGGTGGTSAGGQGATGGGAGLVGSGGSAGDSGTGEVCDGKDNNGNGGVDEGNVCANVPEPCPLGAYKLCDCYGGVHSKCQQDKTWGPCLVDVDECAQAKITSQSQCPWPQVCDFGECVDYGVVDSYCVHHSDCPAGAICDLGDCMDDRFRPVCP